MPMELAVHAEDCKWFDGTCTCTPVVTADPAAARQAHKGNAKRLQIRVVEPPATNWRTMPNIPPHRSQARRHQGVISE